MNNIWVHESTGDDNEQWITVEEEDGLHVRPCIDSIPMDTPVNFTENSEEEVLDLETDEMEEGM